MTPALENATEPRAREPLPHPRGKRGARGAINRLSDEVARMSESVEQLRERLAEAERARATGDADAAAQVRKLNARIDELTTQVLALRTSGSTPAGNQP